MKVAGRSLTTPTGPTPLQSSLDRRSVSGGVITGVISLPDQVPDDVLEEDVDAWWEANANGLRDVGGTLHAVVSLGSVKHVWSPELLDRLREQKRIEVEKSRAYVQRRRDEMTLRHAERGVEQAIERILQEAEPEEDDDWEPLA